MTTEMFFGGLMILTMVAGIVIAMTSTRPSGPDRANKSSDRSKGRQTRADARRG